MAKPFEILLAGDANTGKTTFLTQLIEGKIVKNYIPTVDYNYHIKNNYKNIRFWDYPGKEAKNIHIDFSANNIDVLILFFDVTNMQTFNLINQIIDNVKEWKTKIIIIGNKKDLKGKKFVLDKKYDYFEISSFKNNDVNLIFEKIIKIYNEKIGKKKSCSIL